ncbi:MAG TPA: MDR family MFS transporter [Ktedonobacterales bacterium]|jgi:DHA2 family multidrug resistance protein
MDSASPAPLPLNDICPNHKWWVLVTVVFGAFVSILDSTIVNTALPTIQHDLHANLHLASYVATAYILAAGAVVPLSAFLSNRFGIKRTYLVSLAVFTVSSALCGLAPNIWLLIIFRVLQGAGGAALFPLSFAILFAVFPEEERGKANGIFGIPVLVAPAIGPTLGGYLVEYLDWHWVFYVNVPIGIIGIALGWRILHEYVAQPQRRFDFPGFFLAATGLGLLLFGLSNLAYDGLGNGLTVSGPIVVSLVLLGLFLWVEPRRAEPLLDLGFFRWRNFAVGNVITWIATIGLFVPAFLLPQFLQTLLGLTPFDAGLLLLWQGIGAIVGTITSGFVYNRLGPRALIIAGASFTLVTGIFLANWVTTPIGGAAAAALSVLPWILLPRGFGLPILTQPTNTVSLTGVQGPKLPEATTLNVVARNVTASLAIAVMTNILQQRTTIYLTQLGLSALQVAQATELGAGASEPLAARQAQALAYHDVFLITALSIIPAFILALFLKPPPRKAHRL